MINKTFAAALTKQNKKKPLARPFKNHSVKKTDKKQKQKMHVKRVNAKKKKKKKKCCATYPYISGTRRTLLALYIRGRFSESSMLGSTICTSTTKREYVLLRS